MEDPVVLVAEDETAMRASIEIWLGETEWEVLTAEDGQEAIDLLSEDVDVFVCDRRMPRYNASAILDRLVEEPYDIPVIVLTAYEPDDELAEEDVAAYLTKPVKKETLLNVIDRVSKPEDGD